MDIEPQPIRLRLADLFVWMTAAAVMLGLWSRIWVDEYGQVANTFSILISVPEIIAYVNGATGIWLFGRRWWRREWIAFQPGHWLLCLVGVMSLFYLVSLGIYLLGWNGGLTIYAPYSTSWNIGFILEMTRQAVGLFVLIAMSMMVPVRRGWRWTIVPFLASESLGLLAYWMLSFQWGTDWVLAYLSLPPWLTILNLVLLIVIATWDARTAPSRRDWLHWTGVATFGMLTIPSILQFLIPW